MRVWIAAIIIYGLAGGSASGQGLVPTGPRDAKVVVNSQKSLADAVGDGFGGDAWIYPAEFLPKEFPGLKYVSGPADPGLFNGAWRKPTFLKDASSGVEVFVNCYRWQDAQKLETINAANATAGIPGQPSMPFVEPDYDYRAAKFHDLRAATAAKDDREIFAFRDGDLLFKIEAAGGAAESRQHVPEAVAESIWKFRHAK